MTETLEHRIRQRAHAIWESLGRPHGADVEHWHLAAKEIEAEDAAIPKKKTAKPKAVKAAAIPTPDITPVKATPVKANAVKATPVRATPAKKAPSKAKPL